MLALTQLKPGDILPGTFDLDVDPDTYWDQGIVEIAVYPLIATDEPGTYGTKFEQYALIHAEAPGDYRCPDQYERTWVGANATDLRAEHSDLLALVPAWARPAFRGVMEDAAARQMQDLKMGSKK